MEILFALVVVVTVAFAFVNGFHDAGVTVGNAVVSRALTPRIAMTLAAVFNFVGALLGLGIAVTVAENIIEFPHQPGDLLSILLAGMAAATLWGIVTYVVAIPVSSTYSLVGGVLGSGLAYGAHADLASLMLRLVVPLLTVPIIVMGISALCTAVLSRLAAGSAPKPLFRRSRAAGAVFTGLLSLGHGIQDAQKSCAILMLAIVAYQGARFTDGDPFEVTWEVRILVATALAVGTLVSGWRVARTVSRRIALLDPFKSAIADGVSSVALLVSALTVSVPVSLVYTVVGSNLGTQFAGRPGVIRGRFLTPVLAIWVLGIPAPAVLGALFAGGLMLLGV
ncbi:inorganic phosphate transporter [Brevibacterium sp.]|jgi:PiT family inorganic phosphate transporter|uniref:inorganic phosphate transporter n=1 Tax=Brevibacterium sp. TaxID=1701 RepID=UPI0025C025FF|nr:inorganic phosphate transporter [Brevibacterium sp.]